MQPTQPHLTHARSGLMLACSSASEMLRLKFFGIGALSRPSLRLRGNLGWREPRWFGLVNPLTVSKDTSSPITIRQQAAVAFHQQR